MGQTGQIHRFDRTGCAGRERQKRLHRQREDIEAVLAEKGCTGRRGYADCTGAKRLCRLHRLCRIVIFEKQQEEGSDQSLNTPLSLLLRSEWTSNRECDPVAL